VSGAGYDAIADVYARHWGHVLTEQAAPVVERFVLADLPPGGEILDLCCGTGDLAGRLTAAGYRVYGLDASPAMLAIARERAPGAAFVLADARTFTLPRRVDAVVSLFDSLNHILEPDELQQAFGRVRAALRPGGTFLFDLNAEEAYLARWGDDLGYLDAETAVVVRVRYDPHARLGRFDAAVFRVERDARYRRSDATLLQRPYAAQDVCDGLRRAGFVEPQAYDAERDLGLEGHEGRVFYVTRSAT
jgi:SAM-dependent methyltransferase